MSVVLAACGVESVESAYNANLIRQVGTGSNVLANLAPTMEAVTKAPGNFSTAQLQRPQTLLFKGERTKLTKHELSLLTEASRRAPGFAASARTVVLRLKDRLLSAQVDPNSYQNLSSGAKRFSLTWNAYLTAYARILDSVRQGSSFSAPALKDFRALLVASQLDSTEQFEAVRRRVVAKAVQRISAVEDTKREVTAISKRAGKALNTLIKTDHSAQIIVEQVNRQYPHGFLAEQFKNRSA